MMITLYDGQTERGGGAKQLNSAEFVQAGGEQSAAGRQQGSTPDSTLGQDVLSRVEDSEQHKKEEPRKNMFSSSAEGERKSNMEGVL